MLKGVNRKVVEIHNPESLYFEKAVFYLKPNLTQVPMALLTAEARHCLHPAASPAPGLVLTKNPQPVQTGGCFYMAISFRTHGSPWARPERTCAGAFPNTSGRPPAS